MKATIIEIESTDPNVFFYNHGGVRIEPSWCDSENKTSRFLTQDKRHCSVNTQSYVYIDKALGRLGYFEILFRLSSGYGTQRCNVATCKDDDGNEYYVLCEQPQIGTFVSFDNEGFSPFTTNPKPNRYGRNRDDID